MFAAARTDTVLGMDDEELGTRRGAVIQARRLRLGWDAKALALRAGVSRDTLAKVERDGNGVRPETYSKVERALDDLAEEIGDDGTDRSDALSVTIRGAYGIDEMIFKSPSTDPDVLAEAVAKVLEKFRNRD